MCLLTKKWQNNKKESSFRVWLVDYHFLELIRNIWLQRTGTDWVVIFSVLVDSVAIAWWHFWKTILWLICIDCQCLQISQTTNVEHRLHCTRTQELGLWTKALVSFLALVSSSCFLICKMSIAILLSLLEMNIQKSNEGIVNFSAHDTWWTFNQ